MPFNNTGYVKALIHLRTHEELILYGNLLEISALEELEIKNFLHAEYEKEKIDYPSPTPEFQSEAASWAARVIYLAGQLMLYRENKVEDLNTLFYDFEGEITPSAMLSADLCLRFLPGIINHLKLLDPEDALISILEKILYKWHYSAVSYELDYKTVDFEILTQNSCLLRLYLDRIVAAKNLKLARSPFFKERIAADLGIFAPQLLKDFMMPEPSLND